MTAPAPERTAGGTDRRRWRSRRGLAALLRSSVWSVPLVVSVAVAIVAATLLPAALTPGGQILWWTAVLGSSALALLAADRLMRRLLPLAALLDVSLAFPHRPPSRFAVLRRVRSVEELRARIRNGDDQGAQAAADLLALVIALDEHDRATRGHSERVRLYAELLGEELGLDEEELDRLRWAALLHDIGKLTVPAAVLNKGERLEEDEWERLRRHPSEGARLVGPVRDWLGPWTGAIEHHHERVDGAGYPHGLEGDQIALGGRIVAIADAFETMTAARPYKQPLTVGAARRELVASAGTHFDAHIVRAFLNLSVPRLRHVAGWAGWVASIPGLWLLRRLPRTTGNGVAAAASVAILAASGVVAPEPDPTPEPGPQVAVDAPSPGSDRSGGASERSRRTAPPRERLAAPPDGPSAETGTDEPERDPDVPRRDAGQPDEDGAHADEPGTTGDEPSQDSEPGDGTTDDDTTDDGTGDDDTGDEPPPDGPREPHQVGHEETTVLRRLYLHAAPVEATLRHDVLPLDGSAPDRTTLINYDVDVDGSPGLRLVPSDRGRDETRSEHRQRWAVDLGEPTTVAGRLSVTVWVTAADRSGSTVALEAYVDDCARTFTDCEPVADGTATTATSSGRWQEVTVDVPLGSAVMLDERLLVLTLVAGSGSDGDVGIAFDTVGYPSVLETSVGVIASPALPAAAVPVHDGRGSSRGQ